MIEAVAVAVVACGVLATVESPEPQPVNVAPAAMTAAKPITGLARQGSHPTTRTVPPSGRQVRQAWPSARQTAYAGNALLFVSPRERHLLKAIEKATRQSTLRKTFWPQGNPEELLLQPTT